MSILEEQYRITLMIRSKNMSLPGKDGYSWEGFPQPNPDKPETNRNMEENKIPVP